MRISDWSSDVCSSDLLTDARAVIASAMAAAPRYFSVLPTAALEVRAVEKWRQATASTAFYNPPSADGSPPGIYSLNLIDLNPTQKVQVPAIPAPAASPWHHFHTSWPQALDGPPKCRQFGGTRAH